MIVVEEQHRPRVESEQSRVDVRELRQWIDEAIHEDEGGVHEEERRESEAEQTADHESGQSLLDCLGEEAEQGRGQVNQKKERFRE